MSADQQTLGGDTIPGHWRPSPSPNHEWQCRECGRSFSVASDGTELGHALACPIVDGDSHA
jgi:hypothetical protein